MLLRIATRGSRLAFWQAAHLRRLLAERLGLESEIVAVKTSGDQFNRTPIGALGLKGVFIKELEQALLNGQADLAVHSMKDVPTEIDDRFAFPAVLRREEVRDCLVSRSGARLDRLPAGVRVGTSSLRRKAQLRHHRPDLQMVDLRGNVDTRLEKLDRADYDAIVVAKVGLDRLGFAGRITEVFSCDVLLPAVGQGALAVETRSSYAELSRQLRALDDTETRVAVAAERALLAELEGGCQVPIGAWARRESERLVIDACVAALDSIPGEPDFVRLAAASSSGANGIEESQRLGRELAHRLLEAGADRILQTAGRNR